MQTIFIVEDDQVIRRTISQYLQQWGFETATTTNFADVDVAVQNAAPDLVLMDIKLPFFNGFHWLQAIRRFSAVPVIFLTSASEDTNLVMAMNLGADDFLTKPIELPVLLAKVQGLLRRTYEYQTSSDGVYHHGPYTLAALDNRVSSGATVIDLAPTETRILRMLFAAPGEVVSRESIITRLWENDAFVDQNTLAVTMTRLRHKISSIGLDKAIQTVRGQGYRLGAQPDA